MPIASFERLIAQLVVHCLSSFYFIVLNFHILANFRNSDSPSLLNKFVTLNYADGAAMQFAKQVNLSRNVTRFLTF